MNGEPKVFVLYRLTVEVYERIGYRRAAEAEESTTVELPISAAEAVDLKTLGQGLFDDALAAFEAAKEPKPAEPEAE